MDELISDFIAEASESLDQVEADLARLTTNEADKDALNRILRAMHTIKGACGFLKLPRIEAITHGCEGALERVRDGRGAADAIPLVEHGVTQMRMIMDGLAAEGTEPAGDDTLLHDALGYAPNALDWAAELGRARDKLMALAGGALPTPFAKLNAIAAEGAATLQLSARAPIESAWKTLPLMTRELSASLSKPFELTLHGGDVDVDRAALAPLKDALGHLVRNCADHGLETPEERRAQGKPKQGMITVCATREGDDIAITISDDGRGLDTSRIRSRAISRGLCTASQSVRMSPEALHMFIFAPGFSTAETVTRLSGRGIGLDAVRANIEGLGGRIAISSEPGKGSIFTLTIPASLKHRPIEVNIPAEKSGDEAMVA